MQNTAEQWDIYIPSIERISSIFIIKSYSRSFCMSNAARHKTTHRPHFPKHRSFRDLFRHLSNIL